MVAPGYPQQMNQMQPPMAPPRPVKRGTSKVVPVVVSAGLAVGVFCGLLFGLGTGTDTASADPASDGSGSDTAKQDKAAPAPAPAPAKPALDPSKPMSEQMPQKPAAAGTGSAVAAVKPAAGMVKLTVKIEPDTIASSAKIVVDGKEITGASVDLPADKKSVKVAVTAPGYHSQDKTVDLSSGDTTLDLTLIKRAAAATPPTGATPGPSTPTPTRTTPKKKPPGGLIDI